MGRKKKIESISRCVKVSKYGICVICKQYGIVHRHHLDYERDLTIKVCPKHHKLLHHVKNELEYVRDQDIPLCTYLKYTPIPESVVNSALVTLKNSRYMIYSYDISSQGYALNPNVVTLLRLRHFWHKIINYFELYLSEDPRCYRHIRLHKLSRTSINQKAGFIYIDYVEGDEWGMQLKQAMLSNNVHIDMDKDIPRNEWDAYTKIVHAKEIQGVYT